jgi:hypothetical protein
MFAHDLTSTDLAWCHNTIKAQFVGTVRSVVSTRHTSSTTSEVDVTAGFLREGLGGRDAAIANAATAVTTAATFAATVTASNEEDEEEDDVNMYRKNKAKINRQRKEHATAVAVPSFDTTRADSTMHYGQCTVHTTWYGYRKYDKLTHCITSLHTFELPSHK